MRIADLIRAAERVRCATHVDPDADGLGCCFAFREGMLQLGKACDVVLDGPAPVSYPFLPAGFDPHADLAPGDLLFVFDVTDRDRLGDRFGGSALEGVTLVNVDHHVSNTRFGDLNIVDVDASSSCEVALDLLRELAVPISPELANHLLNGLIFDTQGFHTSSTNSRSLRNAADLVDAGGRLSELIHMSFRNRSVRRMQVWGAMAARGVRDDRLFWTVVDGALLAEFGATRDDADGAINFLSTIGEVDAIVVFKCFEAEVVKVSVRSSARFDAAELCYEFGGGGHPRAAGCAVTGDRRAAIETFLAATRRRLEQAQLTPVR